MQKISGRMIFIFVLMFGILISSVFSSRVATNTQEQHILLTEVMMETKVRINEVTLEIAYLTELRANRLTDQDVIDTRIELLQSSIDDVYFILGSLSDLEYVLPSGDIYELQFNDDFEKPFLDALDETLKHFDQVVGNIDHLKNGMDVEDGDQMALVMVVRDLNASLDEQYDELVEICRDAAAYQKRVSDLIQLISMSIAIALFILLIPFILNNLYKPIIYIRDSFQSLSKGDLSRRFMRDQEDEFKELYDNFNFFLDRLDQVFIIEDNIIRENDFEALLNFISTNLKDFMSFSTFGLVYFNYNDEVIHYRMTDQGMRIDGISEPVDKYDDIITQGNDLIIPIKLGAINVGHYYFENYEAKIDGSRFINLFRDKLTISFYKNILVKDLLNIVTDTLADATEARDPETAYHLTRMSHYAYIIAKKLMDKGLYRDEVDSEFVENTLVTAPMHDIGKVAIPDSILLKPGRLTEAEFDIMKTHTDKGGDILAKLHEKFIHYGIHYFEVASTIAYSHHEKYDGSGYPKGAVGEAIPLISRIIAIADVFDALTSKRPYKEAFSVEESVDILKSSSGSHFDPLILDVFFESMEEILVVYDKYKEV